MADLLRNLHFLILRVAHWTFYHWSTVKKGRTTQMEMSYLDLLNKLRADVESDVIP